MDKKEWKIIDETEEQSPANFRAAEHAEETGSRQVRCSRVCL